MTRDDNIKEKRVFVVEMLLAAAVFLTLSYIILGNLDIFSGADEELLPDYNASPAVIDSLFKSSLHTFDIHGSFIETRETSPPPMYDYKVIIPGDIEMPVVVQMIYNKLRHPDVKIVSQEHTINGNNTVTISLNKKMILSADLIWRKNLLRDKGSISFIISDIFDLKKEEIDKLLRLPETFVVMLQPSLNNIEFSDRLIANRKNYILFINDDIKELTFRLSQEFSKKRLQTAIRTTAGNFTNNPIIVDDNSVLYNSVAYAFIREEFEGRGITLLPLSNFRVIEEGDEEYLKNQIELAVENLGPDKKAIFLISSESYFKIRDLISEMRKKGLKIKPAFDLIELAAQSE